MITLAFVVGMMVGLCMGIGVLSLLQAAHDADAAMSEHVKLHYTVRKGD